MDICKVILSGHLGQDPRIRQLDDGTPVLNLRVANGQRKKGEAITYWWDVTMFGERGLKLHDMLRKGSHVLVEGPYSERTYVDKEGRERTQREVLARDLYILDRKPDEADRSYGDGERYGQGQGNPFGNQRSRPAPQGQQPMYTRSFGGNHRDDFAPGGRAQQSLPRGAPPPEDDSDIPF